MIIYYFKCTPHHTITYVVLLVVGNKNKELNTSGRIFYRKKT